MTLASPCHYLGCQRRTFCSDAAKRWLSSSLVNQALVGNPQTFVQPLDHGQRQITFLGQHFRHTPTRPNIRSIKTSNSSPFGVPDFAPYNSSMRRSCTIPSSVSLHLCTSDRFPVSLNLSTRFGHSPTPRRSACNQRNLARKAKHLGCGHSSILRCREKAPSNGGSYHRA